MRCQISSPTVQTCRFSPFVIAGVRPIGDFEPRLRSVRAPWLRPLRGHVEGDSLAGRYGTFSAPLRLEHYDVFKLHPEVGGEEQTLKVRFEMGMDCTIDQVPIPLESA
jgi:hypothetical protein